MSIITQCPSCGTSFRVTPPQLQAQHGMVRCGRCAQVFDGFKTLATLPDTAASDASLSATTAAEPALQETPRDRAPVADVIAPVIVEATPPPAAETPQALPETAARREAPAQVKEPVVVPPPYPQSEFVAPPPRRAGGWAFGVLLLLTGLAAQGAYIFRGDIAAHVPETRPYLAKMCELLRCTVALPQRPELINIVGSELRSDPANPGHITVTASLRSQATIRVGYPAFDVGLTDTNDRMLARRIFLPTEYLVAGKDPQAGIAPNAEVDIRVDLDTGDLGAAGFRLFLIAAPAR